jgi:hypothetical protein
MKETPNAPAPKSVIEMRRALLGDPLSHQVHSWLRQIYHRPPTGFSTAIAKTTISGMVSVLEPEMKRNPKLSAALAKLSNFTSTPLNQQYAKAFSLIKRPQSTAFTTFVSVVYARAILLLVSSVMDGPKMIAELKQTVSNPDAAIDKYLALHNKLDDHFVGHLVTTAEIEAQLDPHFHKVLNRSSALFVETHMPKGTAKNPLSDPEARLELLGSTEPGAWWHLPANLAFAITVSN